MRRRLPALFLLALGAATLPVRAEQPVSEATVKAAFIYNFTKFVEWLDDGPAPQTPIRICLYGSRDPFLAALAEIDGKSALGRQIRVQKASQSEFKGCQILAIGGSERRQLAETLKATQDNGVLTVSELEGFMDAGGIIGLVVENERVGFEVNLEAARRNNLRISSQLLKLARRIRR